MFGITIDVFVMITVNHSDFIKTTLCNVELS